MSVVEKRLILYELNEVPQKVFEWFSKRNPTSAIARLMCQSASFETVSEDEGVLSPWITWPTVHRGVRNTEHGIFDFGQDLSQVNGDLPPIWDLLAKGGHTVGLFGSLHSYPLPRNLDNFAFYVPDTFAAGPECFPEDLSAFQKFNLSMVDRSGRNVDRGLPMRDAAAFLAQAPKLGLRGVTALKIGAQLAAERVNKDRAVRRRTSQVQIAFDFFLRELKRTTPETSFFFTNHVASAMHRYWPATFPKDYSAPFWSDGWDERWCGEIPFSMGEANTQIATLMKFVDHDPRYNLIVMTSMGQAAVQGVKLIETQLYLGDPRKFMRLVGMSDEDWAPRRAMLPRYIFSLRPQVTSRFSDALSNFCVNGRAIQWEHAGDGSFRVMFGQENLIESETVVTYGGRRLSFTESGLANVRIQDDAGSNAYHIPEGAMFVYDPQDRRERALKRIATTQIAPAILTNFGITPPAHMQHYERLW